ncbi:ornithine decarboxylase-like [Tubulanus polymorphus]|uniref:ornithine decarboxylase-like n=1 Tax=Tubulanus polymorphus TaxID=672921 RepID=UPI003DA2DC60
MKLINVVENGNVEVLPANQTMRDICDQKTNTMKNDESENAFFGCDLTEIIDRWSRWNANLPTVQPFYAVKCNPDPIVLQTMAGLGANFDCASKVEMKTVLSLGVSPKRIILANPCKQSSHIVYARDNGVEMMTFDNMEELHKVKRVYPNAKLVLRILPGNFKAQVDLGIKFGCHVKDTTRLLEKAKELELNVIGVSFHVGSGCHEIEAYPTAITLARNVFDRAELLGFKPYLLDIGGGFPGQDGGPISFEQFSESINGSLEKNFPADCGVSVIAEPGRYFVTTAFTLVTNVIARRTVSSEELDDGIHNTPAPGKNRKAPAFMYYINDGVYGSFNCLLYDHVPECPPVLYNDRSAEQHYASSIWGPTCDGLDCITNYVLLPELDVGDWVFFENMGAYTMAGGSTFNGMPKPSGFYVIDEKYKELMKSKCKTQRCDNVMKVTDVDQIIAEGLLNCILDEKEQSLRNNLDQVMLPLTTIEF